MGVGASASGKPKVVTIGSLPIEAFDAESTSLVRQATATASPGCTPERIEELINMAVYEAFEEFQTRAEEN